MVEEILPGLDSEDVFKATEANLIIALRKYEVSLASSSVLHHLNGFGKKLQKPHITKILQNFWLTLIEKGNRDAINWYDCKIFITGSIF